MASHNHATSPELLWRAVAECMFQISIKPNFMNILFEFRRLVSGPVKNMQKTTPILAFAYTAIAIYIFMRFFYYEEINLVVSLVVPILIFMPLLFAGSLKASKMTLNICSLLGFLIGFATYGIAGGVNIWSIALISWLFLSLPALAVLNLAGISFQKYWGL